MKTLQQLYVAFRRITRDIDLRSKEPMQSAGLAAPPIVILKFTARLEPVTVGDLAAAMTFGQGMATTILNRPETKGLARSTDSPAALALPGRAPSPTNQPSTERTHVWTLRRNSSR